MKQAITARCPAKIDIGPVYACNPQERLKFGGGWPGQDCHFIILINIITGILYTVYIYCVSYIHTINTRAGHTRARLAIDAHD